MDRFAFNPIARLFTEFGMAVFNINYRLLDDAPWPACGDDCLYAGQFLLDACSGAEEYHLICVRVLLEGKSFAA